jgi:hypothetical protein
MTTQDLAESLAKKIIDGDAIVLSIEEEHRIGDPLIRFSIKGFSTKGINRPNSPMRDVTPNTPQLTADPPRLT